MGFGATGPIVWLLGALSMIIIWGGVWWGLSALVFHWPARVRTRSAARRQRPDAPDSRAWQQPTFDAAPGAAAGSPQIPTQPRPSRQQPHTNTESEYR
jgi:hypothetical protein